MKFGLAVMNSAETCTYQVEAHSTSLLNGGTANTEDHSPDGGQLEADEM